MEVVAAPSTFTLVFPTVTVTGLTVGALAVTTVPAVAGGWSQAGNPEGQDIVRLGGHSSRNNGRIGDGGIVRIARRQGIMGGAKLKHSGRRGLKLCGERRADGAVIRHHDAYRPLSRVVRRGANWWAEGVLETLIMPIIGR